MSKYFFTQEWFKPNEKIWDGMLVNYKDKPVRVLEIGSHEGESTTWLLDNLNCEIHCIDPYLVEDATSSVTENTYEIFLKNINASGKSVFQYKNKSIDVLPNILSNGLKFDIIYVNGSFLPEDIMFDALMSSKLLADGGMLIFDNYLGGGITYPIKKVIDSFIDKLNPQEWRIAGHWHQMFLQKSYNSKRTDIWDLQF